jgi:tRNA dimethylallyltransferase
MAQTMKVRIAIVGTTASGKSALSEQIAAELAKQGRAAEIISADSMCVYRGMDVGTAKPTKSDQQRWPTHGIDLVNPNEEFSVAEFQSYAMKTLAEIEQRGAVPILVGGTGLYIDAVVNQLTMPPQFPEIKSALIEELRAGTSILDLYARLLALDPDAAAKMESNNERRIIRALEVCVGSGRRFSSFGPGLVAAAEARTPTEAGELLSSSDPEATSAAPRWTLCGPIWPRPELRLRIAQRFAQQLLDGFVEEAAEVLDRYGESRSKTARQALGYRELWAHLLGECSREEAIKQAILRTGQFAVRQERWFRRDPRINWIPGQALEPGNSGHEETEPGSRSGQAETEGEAEAETEVETAAGTAFGIDPAPRRGNGDGVTRLVNLVLG